jgi:hypothetical protein
MDIWQALQSGLELLLELVHREELRGMLLTPMALALLPDLLRRGSKVRGVGGVVVIIVVKMLD